MENRFHVRKKSNIFPHVFKLKLKLISKTDPLQSEEMYPQYSLDHPDLSVLFCADATLFDCPICFILYERERTNHSLQRSWVYGVPAQFSVNLQTTDQIQIPSLDRSDSDIGLKQNKVSSLKHQLSC